MLLGKSNVSLSKRNVNTISCPAYTVKQSLNMKMLNKYDIIWVKPGKSMGVFVTIEAEGWGRPFSKWLPTKLRL